MAQVKVVDTWKSKKWYQLISPKFLGEVEIAEIPTTDEEHLVNRIIALPLKEVTHDLSHMYSTVRLRVEKVEGKNAYAKFIGHATSREYLSTLSRRNRDLLRVVLTLTSKDGVKFHVKTLIVTAIACSEEQRRNVRNLAAKELTKMITESNFGDFIHQALFNKIAQALHNTLKKIVPIKRVEVYKTELYEVFDVQDVVELDRQKKAKAPTPESEASKESELPAEPSAATHAG
ncbi:MAG TPA: hypothetical protein VI874_01260 [Candidatus Norongarragalinales archaeon]|nr:hypothetical protein [Candidatus Norongarragalinales archaeon]